MKTRHFHSLLSLVTASLLLAACGSSDPGTAPATDTAEQTAPAAAGTAVTETTVDPRYADAIGSHDFGGEDFHFLLCGDGDPYNWSEIDVLSEGETGETINDGIYARNLALEERLNIRITGIFDMNAASVLNKTVSAGDDTYDAAWLMLSTLLYSLQLSTGSFPKPLSEEEERHYLTLAQKGDLEARNVLIERNLRLVAHIMKKY